MLLKDNINDLEERKNIANLMSAIKSAGKWTEADEQNL
jgi:hypothetical protein